jgi:2-octaprenylphenol hydroxylase
MSVSQRWDVVVVGGGVVGLSAAIAMRARNFSVALLDAGTLMVDNTAPDLRVYAVNEASQRLFEALEVWPCFDKTRVSPYQHMHVWDAANGAHLDFDARMVGTDKLGSIIEESVMKEALLTQARVLGVVFFPKSKVSAVQSMEDHMLIQAEFDSWTANLLMVADGAMSPTRALLGVSTTQWPYHQHAIVATIHTEHAHQHTAYQVFNPNGPLAFLPLVDPHQCSIVWTTTPAQASEMMSLSNEDFSKALTVAFSNKLGACALQGARHVFPLHMRHTKQYSGSNWLLMGDAAHTIHPLAGLGLNVGLADLTAWLAGLDATKTGTWSRQTLSAYQRQRKHAVWQIIGLMSGLKTIFANPLPPIAALRGLGLRVCNGLSPLRRLFIEYAMG